MKKILLLAAAMGSGTLMAQLSGSGAYLKGNYVEIGVSGTGGFEGADITTAAVPAGMHFRSDNPYFGFTANPQMNTWSTFDGDFFTPGTPENGWGLELPSSATPANNCAYINDITGTSFNWWHSGIVTECDWEGDYNNGTENLHIKINYHLEDNDLFYVTTITITNNGVAPLNNIYYYRNVDPDNNESISFDFSTQNTIVDQPVSGMPNTAFVSATSLMPASQPMSYFAFVAVDSMWRASIGGFSNRDGSDLYNGIGYSQTVGYTNFADEAIAVSYLIPTLAPSASETFKLATLFSLSANQCAISALNTHVAAIPELHAGGPTYTLHGSPAGGVFSGTGMENDSVFNPTLSGPGVFTVLYTVTDSNGCENSVSAEVAVDVTSQVIESSVNGKLIIAPNPAGDQCTLTIDSKLDLENTQLKIYDMMGRVVYQLNEINSHRIVLPSDTFARGSYIVKFENGNTILSATKLMKK